MGDVLLGGPELTYAFIIFITMLFSGIIDSEYGDPGPSSFIGFVGFIITLCLYLGKTHL